MEVGLIIAFRSRTHTMRFLDALKQSGVAGKIINTPREAGLGCGISILVKRQAEGLVKMLLNMNNFSTYLGTFELSWDGNVRKVVKI